METAAALVEAAACFVAVASALASASAFLTRDLGEREIKGTRQRSMVRNAGWIY